MADLDSISAQCDSILIAQETTNSYLFDINTNFNNLYPGFVNLIDSSSHQELVVNDPALTATLLGSNLNSGHFSNLSTSYWFTLDLTQVPSNADRQKGFDGPDIVYAGWAGLSSSTYFLPRSPVHFISSAFQAQSGTDGFYFTLYNGFLATATAWEFIPSGGN